MEVISMKDITLNAPRVRDTPKKVRFDLPGEGGAVSGSIYVLKGDVGDIGALEVSIKPIKA